MTAAQFAYKLDLDKKMSQDKKIENLVKYAIENERFSPQECQNTLKISDEQFSSWKYKVFELSGCHETPKKDEELCWPLSPDAYWGYITLLAYRDARNKSWWALIIAFAALMVAVLGIVIYLAATK